MVLDIDKIKKLVISLPERTDRREHVKKELDYFGWDFNFIDGVRKTPVHLGIAEAHKKCIKLAKDLNLPYICILEDDVLFQSKEKTKDYLNLAFANVPDDFDILLGGYYTGALLKRGKYWNEIGQFCGLHFYIVAEKFYNRILEYTDNGHIDRYMNEDERTKVYCTEKFFAIQLDGWSDNTNKNTTYSATLNKKMLL